MNTPLWAQNAAVATLLNRFSLCDSKGCLVSSKRSSVWKFKSTVMYVCVHVIGAETYSLLEIGYHFRAALRTRAFLSPELPRVL